MRKARVHPRCKCAFGGLITELCRYASIPEDPLDYFLWIEASYYNVTNIKGLDVSAGPVLTTVERAHKYELTMGQMYGLEMLHHRIGGRPSTL